MSYTEEQAKRLEEQRARLTDLELAMLKTCRCEQDWRAVCHFVKEQRGGEYPRDWFQRVVQSGLAREVMARFGEAPDITVTAGDTTIVLAADDLVEGDKA